MDIERVPSLEELALSLLVEERQKLDAEAACREQALIAKQRSTSPLGAREYLERFWQVVGIAARQRADERRARYQAAPQRHQRRDEGQDTASLGHTLIIPEFGARTRRAHRRGLAQREKVWHTGGRKDE